MYSAQSGHSGDLWQQHCGGAGLWTVMQPQQVGAVCRALAALVLSPGPPSPLLAQPCAALLWLLPRSHSGSAALASQRRSCPGALSSMCPVWMCHWSCRIQGSWPPHPSPGVYYCTLKMTQILGRCGAACSCHVKAPVIHCTCMFVVTPVCCCCAKPSDCVFGQGSSQVWCH